MAKADVLVANFMKKNQKTQAAVPEINPVISSFESLFGSGDLEKDEEEKISSLLMEYSDKENMSLDSDIQVLKQLSREIKAIRSQEVILIGERIDKARDILTKYSDTSMKNWLQITFGSFKTGYNYLSYYQLYKSLSNQALRDKLKKMPQKVVYLLASRSGPIEKKEEIIKVNYKKAPAETISLIQSIFPSNKKESKRVIDSALSNSERYITVIMRKRESLKKEHKLRIKHLIEKLENILENES